MKNILLIGGAGYVGTVITSHFLKKGYKVRVLDNFVYRHQFAVHPYFGDPDYELIAGDMCITSDLIKASEGVTDVIILAGLIGDPITKKYPDESTLINNHGVKNCIDFFSGKGIGKLIFISTCSNYGNIDDDKLADETHPLKPLSLYAEEKVDNEKYLLEKKGNVDYTGVVLRFGTAFGLSPRMRFDLTANEFVRDLFFGKELTVFDEHTWRPYCHVRDFARLLDIVIYSENSKVSFEVFNVGGIENNFTKKMLVDEIMKYISQGKVRYGSNGSDPRNYRVSFDKIKNTLGFEPLHPVKYGIMELFTALESGLYSDSIINKSKYGNYDIFL